MALQDFSSDARLAQAVLLSSSPNFCKRLHRWRSEGQNWRPHYQGTEGAGNGPGIQSGRPGRVQQQSALVLLFRQASCRKLLPLGWQGQAGPNLF